MRKATLPVAAVVWMFLGGIPSRGQDNQASAQSSTGATRPLNVGPALPRTVYAPLVRSHELPYGEIALNNRSPQATDVTLVFHSKSGNPAEPVQVTLQPGEIKHIDVDDLLPHSLKHQRELGGVFVRYSGQWNQVAAQLTLISQDRKGSVDQPLRPDTDFRSGVQDAVWYLPKDGTATIALGNTTEQDVLARVIVPGEDAREVRLRPLETEVIRLHRNDESEGEAKNRVASVRVETSAPAGAVRAVGYVTFEGYARTIRFYEGATVRQPDLFAANLSTQNSEIQIVLKNVSDKPLVATPRFLPVGPGSASPLELPGITLQPGEERLVDTALLEQLAAENETYSRVGVHVRNSGEKGSLIGSLSSFNRREQVSFEIPLRDSGSLRNSGGSYPIRLDGDYSTYVSLMNVSSEAVEFTGVIRHRTGEYVFRPKKLAAGESVLFGIRDLRDKRVPDPNGKTLPEDFERGQFNWSMHQGGAVPKLIGRSQIVSASRGVSASYSCPVCCPNSGPFQVLNPFVLVTVPGGLAFFTAAEESRNCYGGYLSWPANIVLTSRNPSIADSQYVQEGQGQANGYSPGSTNLEGNPYWVDEYLDDGMDCYNFGHTRQTSEPVDVVDVNITSADIENNVVRVILSGPAGRSGMLEITLNGLGAGLTFAANGGVALSAGQYDISIPRPSVPADTYTSITAKWNAGSPGTHPSRTFSLTNTWLVLGTIRHSQYNVPHESACSPTTQTAYLYNPGTCSWQTVTLRSNFVSQTRINGTGVSLEYGILKYDDGSCNANRPQGSTTLNSLRMAASITGQCNTQLIGGDSVATQPGPRDPGSPHRCGDKMVLVNGSNLNAHIKHIADRCANTAEGCADGHVDNYSSSPACNPGTLLDLPGSPYWTVNRRQ